MAYQQVTGLAPSSLQLTIGPQLGIKATRKRFVSPCTNIPVAGPDDTITIYPDTSTPASFLDHESTYLMADLTIVNGCYSVDYANFGVEGAWGAIIQDWQCINQGTPIETINDYPTMASLMTNLEGQYDAETTMFFSNKMAVGFQEEFHKNFIKPPMCDGSKNIMFGQFPFGLGFDTSYLNGTTYGNNGTEGCGIPQQTSTIAGRMQLGNPADVLIGTYDTLAQGSFINSAQSGVSPSWVSYDSAKIPLALINGTTALDWPQYYDPSQSEITNMYVKEFGSVNRPQVLANLCNVKCFPIGMIPGSNNYNQAADCTTIVNYGGGLDAGGVSAQTAKAPIASVPKYRICYRPYSGILGRLASKMLATCLMAPSQFYISIKLAQAAMVFQLSSDPCRRIPGTIRDYVRNLGNSNSTYYGLNATSTYTQTANTADTAANAYKFATNSGFAPGYGPWNALFVTNGTTNITSSLNTLFSSAAASGRSLVQSTGKFVPTNSAGPVVAANTVQLAPGIGEIIPHGALVQYMLSTTPWKFNNWSSQSAQIINYAIETDVFYGTRLKWSVPQTRRIFDISYDGVKVSSSVPETPGSPPTGSNAVTYTLSNIALVGDIISVPPQTAADIIEKANAGLFNVSSQTISTTQVQVQNSTIQQIILPLKANAAKNLWVVFQDLETRNQNSGFFYDSNCGLNIFAQFDVGTDKNSFISMSGYDSNQKAALLKGVGVTKPISYTPTYTDNSQGLSVQLQIGADFWPNQPLTTMEEIVVELVKTMDSWTSSRYNPAVDARVIPILTSGTTSKLAYDCLQPSKFTTAFVPYDLLDDQTITANYDMVPLYATQAVTAGAIVGAFNAATNAFGASSTKASVCNGFNYLCPIGFKAPLFMSPSSRFALGFSFSTFGVRDNIDTYMYLGNNTITLLLKNTVGLNGHYLNGGARNYRGLCIVRKNMVIRYASGGQIIAVS